MAKLYVFGIGGSGSRVIKALTMLFASGVKLPGNFTEVIPIIIDPDISNGDLLRTKNILRLYQEIRNEINEPYHFFSQNITSLSAIENEDLDTINPDFFQFELNGIRDHTFGKFIRYDALPHTWENDDRSFIDLLYSEKQINSKLDVGFKGNPNMGSIVLNQFSWSKNFKQFVNTFDSNDAIFIINSIFGGTGAAGYPLLLKKLRKVKKDSENENKNEKISSKEEIKYAPVGAFTILPYFKLNEKDEIDSDSFEHKAIAAMDYYNKTIIGKGVDVVDYQYFIGDSSSDNIQNYAVGGKEQKNKAHFFELAGALAIMDFVREISNHPLNVDARETIIKEFGIQNYDERKRIITFKNLSQDDRNLIAKPLTKYQLFTLYLKKRLPETLGKTRWTKRGFLNFLGRERDFSPLDKKYFSSPEYENQTTKFNEYFDEWISEMQKNSPSFSPFRDVRNDDAFTLVKDTEPNKVIGFKEVDVRNNELIKDPGIRDTKGKKHSILIKLFDKSLDDLIEKINLFNISN